MLECPPRTISRIQRYRRRPLPRKPIGTMCSFPAPPPSRPLGNGGRLRFNLFRQATDLDRYPVSDKPEFRTTMLECPPRTISRPQRYCRPRPARSAPAYRNDVFFSGSTTGAVRTDLWETVDDSGLTFSGRLQPRHFRTDRDTG